jgi:hypothetical protein
MPTFKRIEQPLDPADIPALIREKLDLFQRHAGRCVECSPRLERVRHHYNVHSLCPVGIRLQDEAEALRASWRATHEPI